MPSAHLARRGLILILSSPSGAGKSTLTRLLIQADHDIALSVSVTTRPRRPSEVDGVHYQFVDIETFHVMRERGEFLEWAEVHGHCYGTPLKPVEKALSEGRDMMFDIDWQGTQQIIEKKREDVVTVFILPPSIEELKARLVRRAEDAPEVIERRLRNAREEISHWAEYDYVLVNDDLNRSFGELKSIVSAERLKSRKRIGLTSFAEGLLKL